MFADTEELYQALPYRLKYTQNSAKILTVMLDNYWVASCYTSHIDKLSSTLVTFLVKDIAEETSRGNISSVTKPHGKGGESRNRVARQSSLTGRKITWILT